MSRIMSETTRIPARSRQPLPAGPRRGGRDRAIARVAIERLDARALPSASPLAAPAPNGTIDLARDLGTPGPAVEVAGSIGHGPAGAAEVDWYRFELPGPARVAFGVSPPAGGAPFPSVLSLYDNDPQDFGDPLIPEPQDPGDPYDPGGHRLLVQVEANPSDGAARTVQDLGPGEYFVAVSGAGDRDFSPVIAGSGFEGATGDYELTIRPTNWEMAGPGPRVLGSDPAAGAILDSSPLAIRVAMSGPLDPTTILPGQTVQVFSEPDPRPGGGPGEPVLLD
jgi:hypothetical protein